MNILLAYPRIIKNGRHLANHAPGGLLILASILKTEGHDVVFVDGMLDDLDGAEFAQKAKMIEPRLIGISVNALQARTAKEYLIETRKVFGDSVKIVIGGPFVSSAPDEVFAYMEEADYAVIGEGEPAIAGLVSHICDGTSIDEVPNLALRTPSGIHYTTKERVMDLSTTPPPDYSFADKYLSRYNGAFPALFKPSMHIVSSRGCPFRCRFCSVALVWDSRVSYRPVQSIIDECNILVERYGAREIFLTDDMLNANRKWFFSLCDAFVESGLSEKAYFKGSFKAHRKITDEAILKRAKAANFWAIMYGIESGSQKILDSINKKANVREAADIIEMTKQAGLDVIASFFIGTPEEDRDTVRETFDFIRKTKPEFGGFGVFLPFPGTDLFRELKELGLADNLEISQYGYDRCNTRSKALSSKEINDCLATGRDLVAENSIYRNEIEEKRRIMAKSDE